MGTKNFFKQRSDVLDKKTSLVIKKLTDSGIIPMDIPTNTKIKSQGANRAWLSSGRFKWTFDATGYLGNIGSCQSIHVLSKCTSFKLLGWEIVGE